MSSSSSNNVNGAPVSDNTARMADLLAEAKAMRKRKTVKNTQQIYAGKIKVMYNWIKSIPELRHVSIDEVNKEMIVPLPLATVEMFFASHVKKMVIEDIREELASKCLLFYIVVYATYSSFYAT